MTPDNLFAALPDRPDAEVIEDILRSPHVRIERIVSHGQRSPASGWYDQDENEWVLLLAGRARLVFADGSRCELSAGDYLHIPAHRQHRVDWTDPDGVTVWLAVFYR
ncbi:MAG TPA: cupin domain-containing protein [Pseudomonadales bacterium]